jgi:phage-related protein
MRELGQDFLEETAQSSREKIVSLIRIKNIDDRGNDQFYTDAEEDLMVDGHEYKAISIQIGQIQENSENEIETFTIQVADVNHALTRILENNDGLRGKRVVIHTAPKSQIDNSLLRLTDIYEIDRAARQKHSVVLTLSFFKEFNDPTPKRNYGRTHCQWTYKKEGCFIEEEEHQTKLDQISVQSGDQTIFVSGTRYIDVGQKLLLDGDGKAEIVKVESKEIKFERLRLVSGTENSYLQDNTTIYTYARTALTQSISQGDDTFHVENADLFNQDETVVLSGTAEEDGRFNKQEFTISGTLDGNKIVVDDPSIYDFDGDRIVRRKYRKPDHFENGDTACDKKLDSEDGCVFHNNSRRFGGFDSVPNKPRVRI